MSDSSDIAIKVSNVSKSFKLPHDRSNSIKSKLINFRKQGYEVQKALQDVSFEVKKGEFFGIVGRNGSGKSTLLKILAGIYTPNSGSVEVNGKLTPFIELGVGFNPELSGRDNVFLNGALLGFTRKEMASMYDEIVEFAELERFMDQKLKNYSSGMQVRLAFSIAIRANTDILVLDEVLAVGDAAFQKKCYSYFNELKQKGKTVILVTHDMGSVQRFCDRAVLIEYGELKLEGDPKDVAGQYILDNLESGETPSGETGLSEGLTYIKVKSKSGVVFTHKDSIQFDVEYVVSGDIETYMGISVLYGGVSIVEHSTIDFEDQTAGTKRKFRYSLPLDRFNSGEFKVTSAVFRRDTRELLGFTSDSASLTFIINNPGPPKGGLLRERGEWQRLGDGKK